jgi:hypothetical protein
MLKKLLLVTAGLALAAPALADGGRHGNDRHRFQRPHHAQAHRPPHRPVVIHHAPRHHYYQPAPVVYYRPAPVMHYYQPAPAYYPIGPSGLSLSFNFPL